MILDTKRLYLRKFNLTDAPFIFELVNSPDWLTYIGNKNVKNLKDAEQYIQEKMLDHYKKHGFGFYLVITKDENIPIGITGFINRESMTDVEVGYGFLPIGTGKGYALEATQAIMEYGETKLNLDNIVAITHPDNTSSQKLLEKLGLTSNGMILLPGFEGPCALFTQTA